MHILSFMHTIPLKFCFHYFPIPKSSLFQSISTLIFSLFETQFLEFFAMVETTEWWSLNRWSLLEILLNWLELWDIILLVEICQIAFANFSWIGPTISFISSNCWLYVIMFDWLFLTWESCFSLFSQISFLY